VKGDIFMAKYIFAPAGINAETNKILKECIEYIGANQTGFGSNLSKGRRYLKSEIGCSCTSVKYLYKTVPKTIGHDFEDLGIYVNKYDKNKCADTLTEIVSYIHENCDEDAKNQLFEGVIRPCPYITPLYSQQKSNLEWVVNHNYKEQGENANEVLKNLNLIKNILD
jgi:hypothetical protein